MIPTLAKPFFLLLIPVGIILILRLSSQKSRIGFSSLGLFDAKTIPLRLVHKLLLIMVVVFIFIALSEPVEYIKSPSPIYKGARDVVVILDTSSSMRQFEKIEIAKEVIGDFVSGRPQDRIGLYSFTTLSYLEWPLSFDHDALLERLSSLEAAGGTMIASGFISGLGHLDKYGQGKGAVIIVSDGVSHVSPKEASAISNLIDETGAKVYWVWIGDFTSEVAIDFKGLIEFLGGTVYSGRAEDLESIFAEISRLETSPVIHKQEISILYKFGIILPLVILSLGAIILSEFVREVYQ